MEASEQHPGSPSSHGTNYSAEYDKADNYFAPGGALSIAAPGRPVGEKDVDRSKQQPGKEDPREDLDMAPLDEKKTPGDGDDSPNVTTDGVSHATAESTELQENKPISASICKDTEDTAAAQEPNPMETTDGTNSQTEIVVDMGSVNEVNPGESSLAVSVSRASTDQEDSPRHNPAVRVETVGESCKYRLLDPCRMPAVWF